MEIGADVKVCGCYAFKQEGQRLFVGYVFISGNFVPGLVLLIGNDGRVDFDQEWVAEKAAREKQQIEWRNFLNSFKVEYKALSPLYRAVPGLHISPDNFLPYLQEIVESKVKVYGFGPKRREKLLGALMA